MIINVHAIPEGHSTIEKSTGLESVKGDLPPFKQPVECKAEIDRTGGMLYIHLWFSGEFDMECSRCLTEVTAPVSGDVRVIVKESSEKEGEIDEDADIVDFHFDSRNGEVDLSPALYDEIMTALPLKPLCNEDCKGIAINDPNVTIGMEEKEKSSSSTDPRWDALKQLKEKKN